ncbi:putative integral membrane protein [Babesia bovis T2Bo]|uniref:Uncharacterized protein n=1 Tax=Babesia bovis TaxID=5865 RepID=A7AW59_BABBO|nr:putative integral membrane protein [Babesia bovis T2Bo]EDO05287.1 putative integral membrane protein [Babesia bovis T2Bo]|eukprot:XP_001608855.1 hypothetical protein [Babesia bovis T2Bo]
MRMADCATYDVPDDVSYRTSSIGTVTPSGAISPSFHKGFMEMQRELGNEPLKSGNDNLEYIRVLQACLSGSIADPATPWSRSTASSDADIANDCVIDSPMHSNNVKSDFIKSSRRRYKTCIPMSRVNTSKNGCGIYTHSNRYINTASHAHENDEPLHYNPHPFDDEELWKAERQHLGQSQTKRDLSNAYDKRNNATNGNVILLDDDRNDARLAVSLLKLRTGVKGQQKIIRLHRIGTHLQLEYSEAVEDLELSYVPTENIAKGDDSIQRTIHENSPRCEDWIANFHLYTKPEMPSYGYSIVWVASGLLCAMAACTLYLRNRNTAVA